MKGRGTALNPGNRFERLELVRERDESVEADDPSPDTVLLRDSTRSIIATNESPDVGFDASVNPYRGCENGCVYCLSGGTPILMADGSTRRLEDVGVGDAIYGTTRTGQVRRYMRTRVLAHWRVVKPAVRVVLEDGTTLVAGGDHRFLTDRGWKFVTGAVAGSGRRPHLTPGNKLMGVGAFAATPAPTEEYRRGYLCGVVRGDGLLACYFYARAGRPNGNQHQFRLALVDLEALLRARDYLDSFDVATHECAFQVSAGRRPMRAIRTHARRSVERIDELVAWPVLASDEWCRGFLAGIFDAEGSYASGTLRIVNSDPAIVDRTVESLERLRFRAVVEAPRLPSGVVAVRVRGGLREHLRFFHTTDPAITRKRDIEGHAVKSEAKLRVRSVEPLGEMPLYDITTGTEDFIANGIVSHNCYARPNHEYLGFSAGLDFETKILVKETAPELLRRELSHPRWEPKTLAFSGVTDAYQPAERKLRLTRRCLEVLVEFRNPVGIVTKSNLVTRDIDLLSELARYDAAMVLISLTSLDPDLIAKMEPRAARPELRLEAVRQLAAAGIPVGVNVQPIIPGLTDHEIPAILEAAAAAGARFAGKGIVRLPLGVADIFEAWLEEHFPARKEKVLNRLREMRGGRLNDPNFVTRMRGKGAYADQILRLFELSKRRVGIPPGFPSLSTAHFRRPDPHGQMELFE